MANKNTRHPIVHLYNYVGTPELVFFIALLLLMTSPVLSTDKYSMINSLLDTFFLGSIYYLAKSHRPKFIKIIGIFLVISIIETWISFFGIKQTNAFGFLLPIIQLILSFHFVFKSIQKRSEVDVNTVLSAISGYMLLGFLFGILIFVLELISPGNFSNVEGLSYYDSIYFSFVTMSTLGYGDITPVTQEGKSLVILTTLVGQFYMVIVMGIIVGKFISNKNLKSA